MASNFDFLKNVDKELYSSILDAEKLFRDEYFTQCCVQVRIYAEKTAKKILGSVSSELTFDDTINCLKDKAKSEQEKEFIEDLFFIKREGNKCAHGEDIDSTTTLETIKRAFEVAINYAYAKKKDEKLLKLQFDETLLITGKPLKENSLVEKYVELATAQQEELLNLKQGEFNSSVPKSNDGIRDESYINNPKSYKKPTKKKKELTPAQQKVKEKIKEAKKSLRENINKNPNKAEKNTKNKKNTATKKQKRKKAKNSSELKKLIMFMIFVLFSLYFLTKMIFFH